MLLATAARAGAASPAFAQDAAANSRSTRDGMPGDRNTDTDMQRPEAQPTRRRDGVESLLMFIF